MAKPKIQIGEQHREMNDAEYAQWQADKAEAQAQAEALEAKTAARQAVLERLGLTVDEAAALFG